MVETLPRGAAFPGATARCQVIKHHFRSGLSKCQGDYRQLSRTQTLRVETRWDGWIWNDLQPAGRQNLQHCLVRRAMTSNLVEYGLAERSRAGRRHEEGQADRSCSEG
jgi:hypothetical protein